MKESEFPGRNGFARRRDLDHPVLRQYLDECLEENRRFCGESALGWSRQWEYPYLLAHLPDPKREFRILDAGSGWRFFAPALARKGFDVTACDVDRSLNRRYAELARNESLALRFDVADLGALRYSDESFDLICCVSVLEHTRDHSRIVGELARCLLPGGTLLVTFDVSVRGDREIPVAGARELIDTLESVLEPIYAFEDRSLLDEAAIEASTDLLRTERFRREQPELLPWSVLSRAGLRNLIQGRLGRPFFDLAVVGMALRKR